MQPKCPILSKIKDSKYAMNLVTFNTCQIGIKCWMSEKDGSIKLCFVIDEQKKRDRFLRNNPSWPNSRFFQCQIAHIWHVIYQTEIAITN